MVVRNIVRGGFALKPFVEIIFPRGTFFAVPVFVGEIGGSAYYRAEIDKPDLVGENHFVSFKREFAHVDFV